MILSLLSGQEKDVQFTSYMYGMSGSFYIIPRGYIVNPYSAEFLKTD